MFIKLTRLDNTSIWINAAFVVTVEPRRGGGAIVVPIGDGLDYDVRETPEQVLSMLAAGPVPAVEVVPVPAPKGLAPTQADRAPEPEAKDPPPAPADAEPAPAKAPRRKTAARKPRGKVAAAEEPAAAEQPQPAADAKSAAEGAEPVSAPPREPNLDVFAEVLPALSDGQLERLKRMAPRSLRKLYNTLVTQFDVRDPAPLAKELSERGLFSVDRDRVIWAQPGAPAQT